MYHLSTNPVGFFADEASTGYDAFKILHTGKDHHGEAFPLFFKGFYFDNVSPYQIYLTVPFVGLFGLNETSVRTTPVFFSLIELIFFYLLLKEVIPKSFSLGGTFLLSISPWHFHLSRVAMGDYYSWTLLTLISLYLFVLACKKKSTKFFILSSLFFSLTTYSYTPARLITPLFFLLVFFIFLLKGRFKVAILSLLAYIVMLIPFINFQINDPHSFQRIKDTMGIDIKKQNLVNSSDESGFYNFFLKKYVAHYSDTFLFEKGDANYPGQSIKRHSISGLGLLYYYQKWLILAGLIWTVLQIVKKGRYELISFLLLFLIFPLADSLTLDPTPYATRSYLGVVPMHLLIGIGIYGLYQFISGKKISTYNLKAPFLFIVAISSFVSVFMLVQKFKENPTTTSAGWGWQYGPRDIIGYFLSVKDEYDELYMSEEFNGAQIFFKFYDSQNSCNKCKLGDFATNPTIYNPKRKQLFSLSPYFLAHSKQANNFKVKKILYYPNNEVAFLIGEVKSN